MSVQPIFVRHRFGAAVCMYNRIIPSRDDFTVFGFRRIPIGTDIGLGALEDHKCLMATGDLFPMRISTREMTLDHAVRSFIFEHSRQMAGVKPDRTVRDE